MPGRGIKLTLVAAPAGYGKTTLLAAWRESQHPRPVAWLTLDEADGDLRMLWSYVLAALRRVHPDLGISTSPDRIPEASLVPLFLPELINALAAVGDTALVLDDFHRLPAGAARDSVAWFIAHAPATFQLVLAARNEPGLPIARLRAKGALLELRAEHLAFTNAEAKTLLNGRLGLNIKPDDIDVLVARTEGWPAGIYLAALALRGASDRHAAVRQFDGAHPYIVDFLIDQVLDAHDPRTRELMLRSSVLNDLSGPLCDAVLDTDQSGNVLTELSANNLFLIPLDDRREWFRFHGLLAQLLRIELNSREPDLVPTLHRRAYAWYREHGSPADAIDHALPGRRVRRGRRADRSPMARLCERRPVRQLARLVRAVPDGVSVERSVPVACLCMGPVAHRERRSGT